MGGELVTAEEASWLEVVKSAANAEQPHEEEERLYPNVSYATWIDDSSGAVNGVDVGISDLVRSLVLKSESHAESEEETLVKGLKKILQQSSSLSKQSFLGLLGSYLRRSQAKQDDSVPSSKASARRRRSGIVDGTEEESTLRLLRDSCRHFGHRLVTLVLECSVSLCFWPPVQILLERRVVVSNSCSKLVPSLVEEEIPLLLCLYINNIPDLTPQNVYTLLAFFLDSIPSPPKSFRPVRSDWRRAASEEIERVVRSRDAIQAATAKSKFLNVERLSSAYEGTVSSAIGLAMAVDGFSSPELCIHHLLASGPDEAVLSSVISKLSTGQVFRLTRYLREWIRKYSSHLDNFPNPSNSRVPSFAQVLSWVGVVLEGHFTQLVLSADFHDELRSMRDMVHSLVDFAASISPLGGMTDHLRSQSLLPVRKQKDGSTQDYVIELLDMS